MEKQAYHKELILRKSVKESQVRFVLKIYNYNWVCIGMNKDRTIVLSIQL